MKWFKHYSNASNDSAINRLEDEFGHLGYAAYWKILEICADKWDGKSDPIFTLNKKLIQNKLRIKSKQTTLVMSSLSLSKLFEVSENDFEFIIKIPKLLKIKDNHTKKLQASYQQVTLRTEQTRSDKKRIEKNIKENIKEKLPLNNSPLEVLNFTDPEINTWLRKGSLPIQEKLLKKYDEEYLANTIEKAFYWQNENKKRQAGSFLSSWIERDNNKRLKGNLSEADFNLKALFEEAAAKVVPYDYGFTK